MYKEYANFRLPKYREYSNEWVGVEFKYEYESDKLIALRKKFQLEQFESKNQFCMMKRMMQYVFQLLYTDKSVKKCYV